MDGISLSLCNKPSLCQYKSPLSIIDGWSSIECSNPNLFLVNIIQRA
jgi:hypothetical protein